MCNVDVDVDVDTHMYVRISIYPYITSHPPPGLESGAPFDANKHLWPQNLLDGP